MNKSEHINGPVMEKLDTSLRSVFDTPALTITDVICTPDEPVATESNPSNQIEADHNFARNNMYNLLQQGQSAFMHALEVAKQSENPRAFEVAGTIMKNLADMNNQLLDLHAKKALVTKTAPAAEPMKVVNNSIVFQGSTADLNKMIQNMRKEQ